ncbi:hypothetical protein EMCRGX_G009831 [Ephydatia muelleri]
MTTYVPVVIAGCLVALFICLDALPLETRNDLHVKALRQAPKSAINCSAIGQKSQRTAFLLSFFLSSVGAANFYIGRNDLGGAQIAVFLAPTILCCAMCCVVCICCREEESGGRMILTLSHRLIGAAISLTITAWWIADLVYFGTNKRLDGNGCPLIANL